MKKYNINENKTLEEVFSFLHMYRAYKKSRRNLGWKHSVQTYGFSALVNIQRDLNKIKQEKYKPKKLYKFKRMERGKTRNISSNAFNDRVIQKCFCDYYLTWLLRPHLIYDSGATLKNKGCDFSRNRIKRHFNHLRHELIPGEPGFSLVMDFHSYFELINHDKLFGIVRPLMHDPRMFDLYQTWINAFGNIGLGLGSQVSQISAIFYVNPIDQYIKRTLKCKYYGRYMDDSYILHQDKRFLQYCLKEIRDKCKEFYIELNPRKTQIVKLSNGLPILQRRYFYKGNTVHSVPNKISARRMINKAKVFVRWINEGKMRITGLYESFQSWQSHLKGDVATKIFKYTYNRCIKYSHMISTEKLSELSMLWYYRIYDLMVY